MIYWVWLSLALGFGTGKLKTLLSKFGSAEGIYKNSIRDIKAVCELTRSEAAGLTDKSLKRAEDIISECKDSEIGIMCYQDKLYPERLRNIPDSPVCLYYKGSFPDFDKLPTICIVGA